MTASEVLKKYWGFDDFRPLQEEIIESVLEGNDTLALLPTGGGKSICYQVPGMVLEGLTLVVTPLISLMKDQVDQLTKRGIRAMAIYAGKSSREIDMALDNCIYGDYKFLYVSPERLQTDLLLARADKMKISLLAVDEAHCISQWGYDFRPPYLQIADFREAFEVQKMVAVTATATEQVRVDIQEKLRMKDAALFIGTFARPNLSYSIFETENKMDKIQQILTNVPGSSVVYVRSRKGTQQVAHQLSTRSISADFYHGGLTSDMRSQKQQKWINNQVRVMVATNAFGMGIDKPDVRTVIHLDLPDSLEAYYQEAGRAGRDEKKAYAVLLFHQADLVQLKERVEKSNPSLDLIKRVYQALANRYKLAVGSGQNTHYDFNYQELIDTFQLPTFDTHYAIKKLESEGLIHISDGYREPSRINILLNHDELYKYQVANASFDPIIKAMLRLYGGEMHADFVSIKEEELAMYLKTSRGQVIKWLDHLNQINVIDYHKTSFGSQITYLQPRVDKDSLPIDAVQLKERIDIVQKKVQSMVDYATNELQCRTRCLQAYFNEITDRDCGVCDQCLKKRKINEEISDEAIIELIPDEGIEISALAEQSNRKPEVIKDKVRLLVESGKVTLVNDCLIKLKTSKK